MFARKENGKLRFERLGFESVIADCIEDIEPKDMNELKWMVKVMIDSIQLVAWEYCNDTEKLGEWEDTHYPADCC